MSYQRPSFPELANRIAVDLELLHPHLREPLGKSHARACHGIHGHLDWLYLQSSPLTCDLERLAEWAKLYSVTQLAATRATGSIEGTGNDGANLLAEVILRSDSGQDYQVKAAATVAGGVVSAEVEALQAGADSNLVAGSNLQLIDPQTGIDDSFTVATGGIGGGADTESLEAWRSRVVDEWVQITTEGARGGKPNDYVFWARTAHQSVTTAWIYPHAMGIGSIVIRPICADLVDPIPTQQVLDEVRDYLATVAPAPTETFLYVIAPTANAIDITIDLAPAADTQANRDAIEDACENYLATLTDKNDVFSLSDLQTVLDDITTQFTITEPLADVTAADGELLTLGSVNFA